ncbi:integrase [Halobacteriales archaeon QS_1_67_19]|nr:MAG: integrase [Halobacteriales archaeon QS_1_67_19]
MKTSIIQTVVSGVMVDTDDVQGYETKYENQMDLLDEADIDARDRDAILKWVHYLRTRDNDVGKKGTVVNHLNKIRLTAERANISLVDIKQIEDIESIVVQLKDNPDIGPGTVRNYQKAIRKFLDYRDVGFADDVTIDPPPERKHDPDKEITDNELNAMLQAANELDSAAREKALIALLRDTGLRIGAVLSLQMKHVNFESDRATVTINTDANVKGADGPKPVTWSRAYVSNWIDIHPRPDVKHAALIHKTRRWSDDEDGALRQQYAGRRIQKIATAAGLDAERIHAHLFRGTAISEWMRDDGLNDQAIKHRVDWSPDSRMFEVYSRVSDEEWNEQIFEHYNIGESGDKDKSRGHGLDRCPHCQTPLRGGERFCPACAGALHSRDVTKVEDVENATFESAKNNEDPAQEITIDEFRRRFRNDPDFRAKLVGEEFRHYDSS